MYGRRHDSTDPRAAFKTDKQHSDQSGIMALLLFIERERIAIHFYNQSVLTYMCTKIILLSINMWYHYRGTKIELEL